MLTKITIKNYKSLEHVELALRPLNVLVGPNNSGKSNILDGLHFLQDLLVHGDGAVSSRGGFKQVVWNGETKRIIAFDLEGTFNSEPFHYQIALTGGPNYFSINQEALKASGNLILECPSASDKNQGVLYDHQGGIVLKMSGNVGGQRLFLGYSKGYEEKAPLAAGLHGELIRWGFYNLSPMRMRNPVQIRKDIRLNEEGENLSAVLHSIHSEYRDSFRAIEEKLRVDVPELKEVITALTDEGTTYIKAKEEGLDLPISSWAMSDGTLALLATLAVLYSPDPPPLICLEEPENFLHPHLLEHLANLLKIASEKSQVLVTTHSPYLLNYISPNDLVVVEKKRGKTSLRRPGRKKALKEALQVLGLGEMWYARSLGGVPE